MGFNFKLKEALERKKNSTPLRNDLWMVRLPDITNSQYEASASTAPAVAVGKDNKKAIEYLDDIADMEELNHRVIAFSSSSNEFSSEQVPDGNTYWYTVSKVDIGNISMSVEEYQDGLTYKYFKTWQDIIKPNEYYSPPALWKKDIEFYRIDVSKQFWLHKHTYKKAVPLQINEVNNTYGSPEILTYDVNFSVDAVKHEFRNISSELETYEKDLIETEIERKWEFSSVDEKRAAEIMERVASDLLF